MVPRDRDEVHQIAAEVAALVGHPSNPFTLKYIYWASNDELYYRVNDEYEHYLLVSGVKMPWRTGPDKTIYEKMAELGQ